MLRIKWIVAVVASASLLVSCGSGTSDQGLAGAEAISVAGEPDAIPKITFDDMVSVSKTSTEVLLEGDGAVVKDGDRLRAHLTIANGFSKAVVFSSYNDGGKPQVVDVAEANLSKGLYEALSGHPIGSRVMSVSPPDDAFGEGGNPDIGVGNKDSVIFIVDILGTVADGPSGKDVTPAAWAPEVTLASEVPVSFDFKDTPKPTDKLRVTSVIEGDGDPVKAGQDVTVNYLGQVYKGKEPFDASFTRGEPFEVVNIGKAGVVDGWNQAIVGVPVGSRIIVSIPPALGYGKAGNEGAGIKGTDTMFFLIDILYVS